MLSYTFIIHLINDFVIQTDSMIRKRMSNKIWESIEGNAKHSALMGVGLLPILFIYENFWSMAFYILVSIILHFIIDFLKCIILKGKSSDSLKKSMWSLILFIVDQLSHFVLIILLWNGFEYYTSTKIIRLQKMILSSNLGTILHNYGLENVLRNFDNISILIVIVGYVCLCGNVLIEKILEYRKEKLGTITYQENIEDNEYVLEYDEEVEENYVTLLHEQEEIARANSEAAACLEAETSNKSSNNGNIVGILERLIVLLLTIKLQFTSIAFVLTAKSMVRSSQIKEDKQFAEIYLIGTLLSIAIAMIGGLIFNVFKF